MSALPPVRAGAVRLARRYARWRVGAELDGVYVSGLDLAQAALAAGPVIFAANHVGWWDGLLTLVLDNALSAGGVADTRVLTEPATVRRLPFLAWMGFVPLRPGALRGLAGFLDRPGRGTWIFPQGRHRPAHLRPLGFRPGVGFVARGGATVVPVAIQYLFRDHAAPAALVRFGAPVGVDALEGAVAEALDALDAAVPAHALVPARAASTDGGLGARMLAGMTRAWEAICVRS